MAKLVVPHAGYCSRADASCWGHTVILPDDASPANHRAFAEEEIRSQESDEHVADLDWEKAIVVDA